MRKHGAIDGNQPNPAWVKRYRRRRKQRDVAKQSRRKNR